MGSFRAIHYASNGGELSRRMEGRADLDGIYDRGFAEMLNFIPTVEGPAAKCPGTVHVRAEDSTAVWIERFIFNTTQAYVLVCLEGKVRFYTNGGRIEVAGAAYEVAVPYTAAQWPRVCFEPSYDRIYLTHPAHPPGVLTRTGAETFAYAELVLQNGPFKATNSDKAKTVTVTSASATFELGGSATVESDHDLFEPGHVGSSIMIEATGFTDTKAWEPGYNGLSVGEQRRSDGKVYKKVAPADTGIRTGSIQPTHYEGTEWDGTSDGTNHSGDDGDGIQWTYQYDRYGIGTITAVASATQATILVTRRLPDMLADGSYKFAMGWCSDADGWPQIGKLWGGRLCLFKGVEIAGSVINDYGGGRANFAPFTPGGLFTPDMAFRRVIAVADPPLWAHADKDYLLAGSASQEVLIAALNRAAGVASDNLRADAQSSYGSAATWPVRAGAAVIFVQRGGRKIREMEYTYERERFAGLNLNIYSRHVTRSGIVSLAFQQEPEEMLWGVRADGTLIAHPHSSEQATKGFARRALGGDATVLCAVVIPSDDGTKDDLWLLADLDGTRHILRLADYWDEDAAVTDDERLELVKSGIFVDFAVSYDGMPKQEFTASLDHLEGRAVRVLADGITIDGLTVSGGRLELPRPASKVTIGLGYAARLTPMRPELRGGPSVAGLLAKITAVIARLIDATNLKVIAGGQTERLFERTADSDLGKPVIFNGDTDQRSAGGGKSRSAAPTFVSDDAGPCTIALLANAYEVE